MGYNTYQLQIIKLYFSNFNQALQYIQSKRNDLIKSPTGDLQLDLISNLLKANIDNMVRALSDCWYAFKYKNKCSSNYSYS